MDALAKANEIRCYRAEVKRQLKAADQRDAMIETAWLICDTPTMMETMKLADLLLAVPSVGQTKLNRILRTARVSPSKTIGGMTLRQRLDVVGQLPHALEGLPAAALKDVAA
jgi:hypothetical protein